MQVYEQDQSMCSSIHCKDEVGKFFGYSKQEIASKKFNDREEKLNCFQERTAIYSYINL
jgi:hypothetical protein